MQISKNQNLKPKKRKGKGKGKSIHIRPPLLCRNPTCYRWGMVVAFLNAHKGLTMHNRKFWLTMHVFLPLAHASNGGLSKFPPWHRRQDSTSYLRVLTWHPVALHRPLCYRSHINIQHHALQIQNLPCHIAYLPFRASSNSQFFSTLPMTSRYGDSTIDAGLSTYISPCSVWWCCCCRGGVTTAFFFKPKGL